MTPQERHLWYNFLRYCKPRFRRQEIIGNYIADFYCHEAKLVLEIDGSQHYDPVQQRNDNIRTQYFHTLGLRVLRFANSDVNRNFQSVCKAVLLAGVQCNTHISVDVETE